MRTNRLPLGILPYFVLFQKPKGSELYANSIACNLEPIVFATPFHPTMSILQKRSKLQRRELCKPASKSLGLLPIPRFYNLEIYRSDILNAISCEVRIIEHGRSPSHVGV